jgi:hypothetical protein
MYGAFSGMSFGLVAIVACLVIALAIFASPLLAVGIFLVAAIFLLIGMSALRQRSAAADRTGGGTPDADPEGAKPRGASAGGATGAPASGEG